MVAKTIKKKSSSKGKEDDKDESEKQKPEKKVIKKKKAEEGKKRPKEDAEDADAEQAAVSVKKKAKSQKNEVGEVVDGALIADIEEISAGTAKVLEARGIKSLFEIQQKAFRPIYKGRDVVGRAKTGCGKTLAFVIPMVERIRARDLMAKKGNRRIPVCVAVAPTRELARQIFTDFESIGKASGLKAVCFYGGTPFGPQCEDLRNGVDLLVCTPGRMLDHVRRETVDLSSCKILVLDEADEMLSMGFQEDVEAILNALPTKDLQKLLFSATLPKWVNSLVEKHLVDPTWVDVVSQEDENATNSKITHKCVSCPPQMRGDCIGDLCKVHAGHFGKTIVFTGTKKECDELAANEKLSALGAGVLHGDIGQNQREQVMDGFRQGRLKCLVATDVAARGIDVPNVNLVIQTHPPQDLDMYVHRAGRTARGGHEGTSVTFYSMREEYLIRLIEHKKGIKMNRIGPPQPIDIVKAAAGDVTKQLDHVHQDCVDAFMETSKQLIAERGAEVVLAASLAALSGHHRRLKGRSLLSAWEGFTALIIQTERGIETNSKAWYLLRQWLPEELHGVCKGMTICATGNEAIFDAPDDYVDKILRCECWRGCSIRRADVLPELQARETDIRSANQQWQDDRNRHWQRIKDKRSGKGGFEESSGKGGGRGGKGSGKSKGWGKGGKSENGEGGGGRGKGGGRGGGAGRGWG
eukprot:TRINITY_DN41958_c0_g1_i1.p1 TRINITY_DN41958_c0_g1~~TRINITY_DN41958_c0_g1_i1.p1  ORF type:complete len:695 (-),score=158.96 TRINITY_DN41958_c0_g1_i1:55-2139(-)